MEITINARETVNDKLQAARGSIIINSGTSLTIVEYAIFIEIIIYQTEANKDILIGLSSHENSLSKLQMLSRHYNSPVRTERPLRKMNLLRNKKIGTLLF